MLNRYGTLGYWRVGYGRSSDPHTNLTLNAFYTAFPEAHPNLAASCPADWFAAQSILRSRRQQALQADQHDLVDDLNIFLETVDYVVQQPNPECYILDCSP
ncbi:MAG TPA: hypothetical protein VD886_26430 [Herpetosiphonaceae bacterium]|nr:hypothetical protein [Herpetosiphonaceae bacterium]